jgi:hypothetical protein
MQPSVAYRVARVKTIGSGAAFGDDRVRLSRFVTVGRATLSPSKARHDGEPVSKQAREVLVPASDVEIINTWDSTGLRGTASDDLTQEVWAKVQSGQPPSETDHGSLWVAATFAAHRSLEAINTLYSAAG